MSVLFSGAGGSRRVANIVIGGCGGFTFALAKSFNMNAVSVLYKNTGILDKVVFISATRRATVATDV